MAPKQELTCYKLKKLYVAAVDHAKLWDKTTPRPYYVRKFGGENYYYMHYNSLGYTLDVKELNWMIKQWHRCGYHVRTIKNRLYVRSE